MYLAVQSQAAPAAARGVSGLGAVRRIPVPRVALRRPVAHRRGFAGLGACNSIPGSQFCFDPATGNVVNCADPVCAAGGSTQNVGAPVLYVPTTAPTTEYVNPGAFNTPTQVASLDTTLAQWLQNITAVAPDSLGISQASDLMASAAAIAARFCQESGNAPDCVNAAALAQKYGSLAVAAFAAVPASQFNPQSYTAYHLSAGSPAPAPSSYVAPSGSSSPAAASAAPASATLQNVSRPGQPFKVGDSWQLTLSGAANAPVSGSASQDGASLGTTAFGSTDQTGVKVLTGSFTAGESGAWREMWSVGSQPAPVLTFTVAAAPSPAAGSSSEAGSNGGNALADSTGGSVSSLLNQSFSIGGFNVPLWGAGAAVLGALYLFGGRR